MYKVFFLPMLCFLEASRFNEIFITITIFFFKFTMGKVFSKSYYKEIDNLHFSHT